MQLLVRFTTIYVSTCPICRDEEPPRKKRRSKWDITAPQGATPTNKTSAPSQGAAALSLKAVPPPSLPPVVDSAQSSVMAAAVAAKINAKLAEQGKLLKSDPPLAKVRYTYECVIYVHVVYMYMYVTLSR